MHADRQTIEEWKQTPGQYWHVAQAIESEIIKGADVRFHPKNRLLNECMPDVSEDTMILVGGGMLEICIEDRARALREAGFTYVFPCRIFSIFLNPLPPPKT